MRAINLGTHGKVAMADLRSFFFELGFDDAQTVLQTGNVVFSSETNSGASLEQLLQAESAKRLSLSTDYLVRDAEEWIGVVRGNPFPEAARSDPAHLVVVALKESPTKISVEALRAAVKGSEEVRVDGRHAYITYPDGIARSRLTMKLIESKLGTRGTGRNWNTVRKVADLAQGAS